MSFPLEEAEILLDRMRGMREGQSVCIELLACCVRDQHACAEQDNAHCARGHPQWQPEIQDDDGSGKQREHTGQHQRRADQSQHGASYQFADRQDELSTCEREFRPQQFECIIAQSL